MSANPNQVVSILAAQGRRRSQQVSDCFAISSCVHSDAAEAPPRQLCDHLAADLDVLWEKYPATSVAGSSCYFWLVAFSKALLAVAAYTCDPHIIFVCFIPFSGGKHFGWVLHVATTVTETTYLMVKIASSAASMQAKAVRLMWDSHVLLFRDSCRNIVPLHV